MNDLMWLTSLPRWATNKTNLLSTYEQLFLSQRLSNPTMRNRPLLSTLSPDHHSNHVDNKRVRSLTKHKESISSGMLRNWNTQGSYAEASLLRKEFGLLGLRYAGRIRSPLPVSGIAAPHPVSRFVLRNRVDA